MLPCPQPSAPASSTAANLPFMEPLPRNIPRRGAASVPRRIRGLRPEPEPEPARFPRRTAAASPPAEQQLHLPAESLDRRLARQRRAPLAHFLQPCQLDGEAPARVLDRAAPVGQQAPVDVV